MQSLIFYHHDCLDGSMSACILKTIYPLALMVPFSYSWKLPSYLHLLGIKKVIFTDITPKKETIEQLFKLGVQEVIILDHHEGAVSTMETLHYCLETLEIIKTKEGFAYDNHQQRGKICLFNGVDVEYKKTQIHYKPENCQIIDNNQDPFEKMFSDISEGHLTESIRVGFEEDPDETVLATLSTYYVRDASAVGLAAGYVKQSGLLTPEVIKCCGFKYLMGVVEIAQRYDLGLHQGDLYRNETLLNTYFHDVRTLNQKLYIDTSLSDCSKNNYDSILGYLMVLDRTAQAEVFNAIRLYHEDKNEMKRIKILERAIRDQELEIDILEVQSFWISPFRIIFGRFENELRNETAYLASKKDPWFIGMVRIDPNSNHNPNTKVRLSLRAGTPNKQFTQRGLPTLKINFNELSKITFQGAGHPNAAGGVEAAGYVVGSFAKALLTLKDFKSKDLQETFAIIESVGQNIQEIRPFDGASITHRKMTWKEYINEYTQIEPMKTLEEISEINQFIDVRQVTLQSFNHPEAFIEAFSQPTTSY